MTFDVNTLLAGLQLAVAGFQLTLDHFSGSKRKENISPEFLFDLGHALRSIEFAVAETIDAINPNNKNSRNEYLAGLWREASESLRRIDNNGAFSEIMFEKSLYWRNPEYYENTLRQNVHSISLRNVLLQLRKIKDKYERLQRQTQG